MSDQLTPQDLSVEKRDKWLGLAEPESPARRAAIAALEVANKEIRKQRAGHEPTVDITSSLDSWSTKIW